MPRILFFLLAVPASILAVAPVQGTHCAPNQVINRLTANEDGSLEAECGPMPCGTSGLKCEEEPHCRVEKTISHGIRWAASGKSLLQHCCSYNVPNKIYTGTDIVSYGTFYQGGAVTEEGNPAPGFDFIANMRAEQGGVRVWVYRIMCNMEENSTAPVAPTLPQAAAPEEVQFEESNDEEANEEGNDEETAEQQDEEPQVEEKPFNPLRYRPPSASTGVHRH